MSNLEASLFKIIKQGVGIDAHFFHFKQGSFLHLLQCTNLTGFLLPRKEYLAIPALANLCNDMELVNLELCSATTKKDTLASAIGFEFFRVLRRIETAGSSVVIEFGASFFARCEVSQVLKIVVEEIYESTLVLDI